MKKIVTASLVTALALTSVNASSLSERLASLEAELADVKKKLKKQNKKINKVKAHGANDNIKWGVDLRTSIDNINYDLADGSTAGKSDLMATRLWLNMEFAPDANNIFKGQLSYNKAFGADLGVTPSPLNTFGMRGFGYDTFNWFSNESLTNDNLKVRQAYWLYLGDSAFGTDMPWTFSVGRRPSTGGFLASLREDDEPLSPLGHIINVEFDGLSSKLDLSGVTGVPGMSFKICMGQGATNAVPMLGNLAGTQYSEDEQSMDDIQLAGFIFEPYNDGQFIVKTTAYRAFNLPGFESEAFMQAMGWQPGDPNVSMSQVGDIDGAAISVLVDGLAEDGILSGTKVFGSFAWSKTRPDADKYMLGLDPMVTGMPGGAGMGESKTGTSYWVGAQVPVLEDGKLGVEYNHGSQYWRPFTYGEDTMIGSKLAARGDAIEAYFTYQLTDALSAQVRYTKIDYDYTGSNGFFASGGTPLKIDDVKAGASMFDQMAPGAGITPDMTQQEMIGALMMAGASQEQAVGMVMSKGMVGSIVESAQDFRFYIRYQF